MPAGVARLLRPRIGDVADRVITEIQRRVPEYARPEDEVYIKVLRLSVNQADAVLNPQQARKTWEALGAWLDQVEPQGPPELTTGEAP